MNRHYDGTSEALLTAAHRLLAEDGPEALTVRRIAGEAGISAFLMTVMVATGANSGALSPFAPTGIIANGQLARIGITGVEWPTFLNNFVAEAFVGKNLVMKRFAARARGRASRIEKPFSEITIVVRELGEAA